MVNSNEIVLRQKTTLPLGLHHIPLKVMKGDNANAIPQETSSY